MSHFNSVVVVLKTLSLVMGGLVTFFAYKAYRRTEASALRALAIGFGLVTLGALLAGALDQLVRLEDRTLTLVVESALTTLGFGVILYSLYVE